MFSLRFRSIQLTILPDGHHGSRLRFFGPGGLSAVSCGRVCCGWSTLVLLVLLCVWAIVIVVIVNCLKVSVHLFFYCSVVIACLSVVGHIMSSCVLHIGSLPHPGVRYRPRNPICATAAGPTAYFVLHGACRCGRCGCTATAHLLSCCSRLRLAARSSVA